MTSTTQCSKNYSSNTDDSNAAHTLGMSPTATATRTPRAKACTRPNSGATRSQQPKGTPTGGDFPARLGGRRRRDGRAHNRVEQVVRLPGGEGHRLLQELNSHVDDLKPTRAGRTISLSWPASTRYSLNNLRLIHFEKPDASIVMSKTAWRALGRWPAAATSGRSYPAANDRRDAAAGRSRFTREQRTVSAAWRSESAPPPAPPPATWSTSPQACGPRRLGRCSVSYDAGTWTVRETELLGVETAANAIVGHLLGHEPELYDFTASTAL
jgi:hypothetical protein